MKAGTPVGAADTGEQTGFDDAFRARLRDLLIWRRDVRRFRRDPLPPGTLNGLIELACRAPSVGLSQPWRFVVVEDPARRAAIRRNFEGCNAAALAAEAPQRAPAYAQLKLAGLDDAPCHLAVFADRSTGQGHGLGGTPCRRWWTIRRWQRCTRSGSRRAPMASAWDGIDPRARGGRDNSRRPSKLEVHRLSLPRISRSRGRRSRSGAGGLGAATPGSRFRRSSR